MNDQAKRLREMTMDVINSEAKEIKTKDTKIYSVISGKGGVGKTNFSINLAIKLQQKNKKVLILDADIGMSNANILLGIPATLHLSEVIKGEAGLEDIIIEGPGGINLISGGTDLFLIETLDKDEQLDIIKSLEALGKYDVIIIDNGAGINNHSLTFSSFADELILVTTPEPTAITDAYRILKASNLYNIKSQANVVINQIVETSQGQESFNKLQSTCKKFLDLDIKFLGYIFNDVRVNKSIMEQNPLVLMYPKALASENIDIIAKKLLDNDLKIESSNSFKKLGNKLIKFFG